MEKDFLLHGFIFPVFQLCLLIISVCITIAVLSKNKTARIISLQIVCILGGLGMGIIGYCGIWSAVMLPCAVMLLIAFGGSMGKCCDKS